MPLELRPYQREAIDATHRYWANKGRNGLIVIPTGGGKSLILAELCRTILEQYPTMRIGIVTHVKELISQNAEELIRLWRGAPVGIYSAGVGRRDTRRAIMFMGIQSVFNKAALLGPFDLLMIDEAHLVPRDADTMYGRFINDLLEMYHGMRVLGLTATPYRLDSGLLYGKGNLFSDIIYEANVSDLIEAGYLSPLISKATLSRINTEGLHKRAGDFVQSEMDERARVPTVVESAVREIVAAGQDRHGWLCFCTSVDHAFQVRNEIRRHNIICEAVTGDMGKSERDGIIARFKARQIRCLTSVGVLTTGFNAPHVDLLALLRPTLSISLYVQMVGRAFRLAPGKANALILDFAGNVLRHGPIDMIRPPGAKSAGKGKAKEEPEVRGKECPVCKSLVHYSARECPDCHFQWPPDPPKHEPEAEDVAILSSEAPEREPDPIKVTTTRIRRHQKDGAPDTMKVEFLCGKAKSVTLWLHFDHWGKLSNRAAMWWTKLGGRTPTPSSVNEALDRADAELAWVDAITTKRVGKYDEVDRVFFCDPPTPRPERLVREKTREEREREEQADREAWERIRQDHTEQAYARIVANRRDPNLERIIVRIIALRAKTARRGCTQAEADSAASMAAKLMTQYGISESEVRDAEIPF